MALSGVHITFGYCNVGFAGGVPHVALPYGATGSQLMANPGQSSIAAQAGSVLPNAQLLLPMLTINASAAIFYTVGPNADTNVGPLRYFDPSFGAVDILVDAGDKIAWIAA
ncbi:hypothetical protein HU675_0038280 [Bradyrhizobium septentrionale]|uniref:hypothetical protein n=1 Tax=Bradyrhizobium septentrionale TaxID=1404411 RepID=UPI001596DD99|nr:hypothetical protein [Bradyrhizobium septentrionale]UGY23735.1 hypothetical protein HU675_0038280 [Bradyrhizobium septentrionale]